MAPFCDICGKIMTIVPGMLSYNTIHNCITGTEMVCMYDVGDECVYWGIPPELDNERGLAIRDLCKSFVKKELYAKNYYLIRALRNSTTKILLDSMSND